MSEIVTIVGLPDPNKVLPDSFMRLYDQVANNSYKSSFWAEFVQYYASGHKSADNIRTVVVEYNDEPLMYAYVIELGKYYYLMEIGYPQVYRVAKEEIEINNAAYHRLPVYIPHVHSENSLFIAVRDSKNESYIHELWLQDIKIDDFTGGSMIDAYRYLKNNGYLDD